MKFNKEQFAESKAFKFVQKYWLYIIIVLAVIIVAVSSINIYREEILEIDPGVEFETQNDVRFAAASFDTLNPIVSKSEDTYYVSKLIYNSLFDYTENLNVAGELVENYSVDTEKAYIDIKLKNGVTWHDGSRLTAKDVKFTVNAIKSYGSKGLYYDSAAKIHSINVKDDLNLRIYFSNNQNCALDDLTFPILPAGKYSGVNRLLADVDGFVPVGTGQYQYTSYDYLKELKLSSNQSYFGAKAQNSVTFKILPNKKWSPNMLETESVTCYTDRGSQRKSLVSDKKLTQYDLISNDAEFLVFNTKNKPLNKKLVRQGICYGLDSKQVLENGYMNDGVLSDTIYYPGFLGAEEVTKYYEFNRDKAKEILAKAGYTDKDLNGKLEDSKGASITLTILVNNDNANRIAAAKIVSKNLQNIGFDVKTKSVGWDEYVKLIDEQDFDILITGYQMDAAYDLRQFFDGKNPWGYNNPKLLTQVKKLDMLYSAEEYAVIYKELKQMLLDEMPYYSLCYKKMGLIGIDTFEAQKMPMFNDIYKNCDSWSWKKKIEKN